MAPESDSLRSLIGGRWAVSWQGYLLGWPFAVLFTFFAAPSLWVAETTLEGLVRGVVAGTLGYAPIGMVLWLAAVTVLKRRCEAPAPITVVALVGAVAWTTRSLAIIAYLQFTGLPSDATPTIRLITGLAQGAIATTLAAWLLATTDRFHQRRKQLLSELVQEEIATEQLASNIDRMRIQVLSRVRRNVDATVSRLDDQVGDEPPTTRAVDALAAASQRVSRELARELLDEASRTVRLNPLLVVRSAVMNRPFAFWGLLPSLALGLVGLSIYWPLPAATMALAAVTVFVLIVSSVTNSVTPRLSHGRGLAVYFSSVVLLLGSAVVMQFAMNQVGLNPAENDAVGWSVALNFGLLYPLIGVAAHVGTAREEILARLRRSVTAAEVEREALRRERERLHRDLAFSLHGGLQADLTASAMRAQHAIDEGDSDTAQAALSEARLLIQESVDLHHGNTLGLDTSVRSVCQAWEGIVDITTTVHVADEPDAKLVTMVKDILLEGIGNAVRHGGAHSIDIAIADADAGLRVTITDDGCGVGDATPGLGSSMFDQISPQAWSLKAAPTGGSILTVALDSPR